MSASFVCRTWGSASLNYLRGPQRVSDAYNVRFTQRNGKSKAKCWIRTSCVILPSYFLLPVIEAAFSPHTVLAKNICCITATCLTFFFLSRLGLLYWTALFPKRMHLQINTSSTESQLKANLCKGLQILSMLPSKRKNIELYETLRGIVYH